MNSTGHRVIDDLSVWVKAFSEFGIDISQMSEASQSSQQIDITEVDGLLEDELEKDAHHQRYEWIIRDRAWEAYGLLEADGPGIGVDGRLNPNDYSSRGKSEHPFINLMKGNVERVIAQLETSNLGIHATPRNPDDRARIQALNDLKDSALDNSHFEKEYQHFIREGVTFGSGYLSIEHGAWMDNPDLSSFAKKFSNQEVITQEEFIYLKKMLKGHKVKHVPTFEMINYRGAKGIKSRSIHDAPHRWLHRVEQIPIAQARVEYPEYAEDIYPITSGIYQQTNPEYYYRNDIEDTVTRKKTWIRFSISGVEGIRVEYPDQIIEEEIEVRRWAIAEITRIEGFGVVDMDIDVYDHHRFPFTNWVYSDSYRHSRGIGICKYGRDPQIVHNMMHNGMLEWFATSVKNGGFIDDRLGLTDEQLNKRSRPGEYIRVKVPQNLEGKTLKDLVVNEKPPTFPHAYAELMNIEANAIDEAMNVPNVSKGIKSGSSGLQEQVLQQQADLTHSTSQSALSQSLYPLGVMMFSNLQQFERDPITFTKTDPVTGSQEVVEINMPKGWYLKVDAINGMVPAYSYVENDISSLMFNVQVNTRSVIPTKPAERAVFMNNFYSTTAGMINDPIQREWLKGMNKWGYGITGVDETLDNIEEKEAQRAQQQQQMFQIEQQEDKEKDMAEMMLEKRDRDIKDKKIEGDFYISQQKIMLEMFKMLEEIKQGQLAQKMDQVKPILQQPQINR